MHRFATFPTFCDVPAVPLDKVSNGVADVVILGAPIDWGAEAPIVGADVVEVSPPYDGPGQITAFLADRMALEILNGMAERSVDTHP